MSLSTTEVDVGRRRFLQVAGLTATVGATGLGSTHTVAAQPDDDAFDRWFADVENYEGVVDRRGQSEVTVTVGATGNGGPFAFDPAAIRVDPGTTVIWEWTGEGGDHNVVATDGAFESDLTGEAGHTFAQTFQTETVSLYSCTPHEAMGMKGAVVVGDMSVGTAGGPGETAFTEPDYGGWFDDVENFDGTEDATGQEEVRIAVGAPGTGGDFAFEPAAVRVDPGTTVVWEWTGEGGQHNVYDDGVGYESPMYSDAGATYALTFDGEGISKYACAPHESMGMKGAVVVGNPAAAGDGMSLGELALWVLVFGAAVSPLAISEIVVRRRDRQADESPAATAG